MQAVFQILGIVSDRGWAENRIHPQVGYIKIVMKEPLTEEHVGLREHDASRI